MDGRIVEQGLRNILKQQLICEWLPDPKFESEIDWEHNLCKQGCDGNDVACRFHPFYRPGISGNSRPDGDLPYYCI